MNRRETVDPAEHQYPEGLHCKGCDCPVNMDPELCDTCLEVAHGLFNPYDAEENLLFVDCIDELEEEVCLK